MFRLFISLLLTAVTVSGFAQITVDELISQSISHHDPKGVLEKQEATLQFVESRPNAADRNTTVVMNPYEEAFQLIRQTKAGTLTTSKSDGVYQYTIDDRSPTADEVETYKLNPQRSEFMRTYYHYLWYMPMKLRDPGTIIDPEVKSTDFFGKKALEIRVTYAPTVGGDIWYFYFDPSTSAMIGYRFYHDESANDGEYILLEGEATYKSVRLPKNRTWYTHKDDRLLGTDILDQLSIK